MFLYLKRHIRDSRMSILIFPKGKYGQNRCVVVSDIDADLAEYGWRVDRRGFVYTSDAKAEKKFGKGQTLHTVVMSRVQEIPPGMVVHHESGDRLNNQRDMLAIISNKENIHDQKQRANQSGYRGVRTISGKHHVRIDAEGKQHYLGSFDNIEYAAMVYDAAVRFSRPKRGRLNFPDRATPFEIENLPRVRAFKQFLLNLQSNGW